MRFSQGNLKIEPVPNWGCGQNREDVDIGSGRVAVIEKSDGCGLCNALVGYLKTAENSDILDFKPWALTSNCSIGGLLAYVETSARQGILATDVDEFESSESRQNGGPDDKSQRVVRHSFIWRYGRFYLLGALLGFAICLLLKVWPPEE